LANGRGGRREGAGKPKSLLTAYRDDVMSVALPSPLAVIAPIPTKFGPYHPVAELAARAMDPDTPQKERNAINMHLTKAFTVDYKASTHHLHRTSDEPGGNSQEWVDRLMTKLGVGVVEFRVKEPPPIIGEVFDLEPEPGEMGAPLGGAGGKSSVGASYPLDGAPDAVSGAAVVVPSPLESSRGGDVERDSADDGRVVAPAVADAAPDAPDAEAA
jgi:hypothetical protein